MDNQIEVLQEALGRRYTIQRPIGRGGMATVYLAEQPHPARQVAIKVMEPALSDGIGRTRFLREVEIVSRLTHPNIVPIFSADEVDGFLYYVMPYVDGLSLRLRLMRRQSLTEEDALRITQEVADALDYAHSLDVIHRDIKPGNILLEAEHAVVTDFGIARALSAAYGDSITLAGVAIGTPGYMSPEQAFGSGEADARSDIYSLACVLHEMLHGGPPTLGLSPDSGGEFQALEAKGGGSEVTRAVEPVLRKAVAWDPADRYGSVAEFAAALSAATSPPCSNPAVHCTGLSVETVPEKSVAVLPFANLSANPDNEYFSDGMTDEIITQLSKAGGLKVTSRTSAMRYKDGERSLPRIGAELGVANILEGSVRRAGDRVRITAQLIDVQGDSHLWAETYDRDLKDIFEIQSDVARKIVGELEATLSPDSVADRARRPTADLEAYNHYLRGMFYWHQLGPESGEEALACFEKAIERDPDFAMAHAGLANAYLILATGSKDIPLLPADAFQLAKTAAERALELDPSLCDAHATIGSIHFWYEWDWAAAERAFSRAFELSGCCDAPRVKYGSYLAALGRHDEAIDHTRHALEYDPVSLSVNAHLAKLFYLARRFDDAVDQARRTLELDFRFPWARVFLGLSQLQLRRVDDAVVHLEKAAHLSDRLPNYLAALGCAYAAAGRVEDAQALLQELDNLTDVLYVPPHTVALVHAWLGNRGQALDWVAKAFDAHDAAMPFIRVEPIWDPLRKAPEFQALVERMRLPVNEASRSRSLRGKCPE